MTLIRHRPGLRRAAGLAAAAAFAVGLSACSSGSDETSLGGGGSTGDEESGDLTELNISMVPVLDAEPFLYAQEQGYYEEAGLDVNFETNDSGPAVVTGVVNGTYDAAAAAWFPISIAIAKGAELQLVTTASFVDKGAGHGHSGLVVAQDSPIESYADLEGATVATNALTSLTTLTTEIEMDKAGADPEAADFTALPFKASVQAVAQDQADAAVVVSPFQAEGKANGMTVLDDPILEAQPENGAGLVLFTSDLNAGEKKAAFESFNEATFRAAEELQADEDLQRQVAEDVVGLSADVAQEVPMPGFATDPINLNALQGQLDLADEYGYLEQPLTAEDIVFQSES